MYLVTTNVNEIPLHQVIMLDGTVPKWTPKEGDIHFDHHRPGGAPVQIEEIGRDYQQVITEDATIVTTQVDADACVAAAWIQLSPTIGTIDGDEAWIRFYAIAHDCDHLELPPDTFWDPYRDFARKAVAALKEVSNSLVEELGLPSDRKTWTQAQKTLFASKSFENGTQWLMDAALGKRPYPGEQGEADPYFEKMEGMRSQVYENCRLYRGVAIFNQRSLPGYVDPRLLVEWAREQGAASPVTLTVRDGTLLPNASILQGLPDGFEPGAGSLLPMYSYTLGSIPLHHEGSPKYSDRGVWSALQDLEKEVRDAAHQPHPETSWGGRNEVGGSGWRDPAIANPEQVVDRVLKTLYL